MNVRDVLLDYRFKVQETEMMNARADKLKHYLGYLRRQHIHTELTARELSAMRQLNDINRRIEAAQEKLTAMEAEVDQVIRMAHSLRLRYILRQYYVDGLTDEAIAEGMDISTRYVNRLRNEFLHQHSTADPKYA